ncbi:diguanylate cyclase [Pelagibacterium montanilacus]|uniref:diguanylate cyclase n=1 Tax=Pelagibacterium montanilacus TaxID=2185280 RepID=UPI0013E076EC|nr:diguanylate cyclase [Pelagibacterium montanilacus]
MIKELFASFAVVALFVAIWALSQEWVRSWPRRVRMAGAGLYMGAAAIATMIMAVPFQSGFFFDLRSVLVGLAGFFADPLAGVIAGLIAAAYRFSLGGAGLYAGFATIAFGVAAGWLAYWMRREFGAWTQATIVFCLLQAVSPLITLYFLPAPLRERAFFDAVFPMMGFNLLASVLSAIGIEMSRRRGWLIHMLRASIAQAPDYFYVKDRHSRLVIANKGVLASLDMGQLKAIFGKTDFDFSPVERARTLYDEEQALLASGVAMVDKEETLPTGKGGIRTFLTTKTPILNEDGTVAGLVGVTKDLTERVTLERQLREKQSELDTLFSGMSDGLARFDGDNRLLFSNANYQALFPRTGDVRQPGALLADILDAVLATGEQNIGDRDPEQWKQWVLTRTSEGGEEQVSLADGRWLHIKSRRLETGGSVVIVSDVTALKQAEAKLADVAEQFRVLATTDALTGLHNRRDFDHAWENEFLQARLNGHDISLIVTDIDHFKAYNDTYGHPAGDACLRQVADCVRKGSQRGPDMAARFGGEEFAVILPRTDTAGVAAVASRILSAVEGLAVPHSGSPAGAVTVSIGNATLSAGQYASADAMLKAADDALYRAKAEGRGRAMAAA